MNSRDLRELLKEQRSAKKAHETKLKEIDQDTKYSAEYKKALKEKATADYMEAVKKRSGKMVSGLNVYKLMANRDIDMSDAVLTNYIQIVSMMGKDTPAEVVDNVIKHYKDHSSALKMITDIGRANGAYVPTERYIIDEELIDTAINEATADFENSSALSAVGTAIFTLEQIEGTAEESAPTIQAPQLF